MPAATTTESALTPYIDSHFHIVYVGGMHMRITTLLYCRCCAQVAVIYGDRTLMVWSFEHPQRLAQYRCMLAHSGPIWGVRSLHLPPTLEEIRRRAQGVWSDEDAKHLSEWMAQYRERGPDASALTLHNAFPNDPMPMGTFVTTALDGTVRFWNLDMHTPTGAGRNASLRSHASDGPGEDKPTDVGGNGAGSERRHWKKPLHGRQLLHTHYFRDPKSSSVRAAAQPRHRCAVCIRIAPKSSMIVCAIVAHTSQFSLLLRPAPWNSPPVLVYAILQLSCVNAQLRHPVNVQRDWQTIPSTSGIRSLAARPGARQIAVGHRSGVLTLLNLEDMGTYATVKAHDKEITCLEFGGKTGTAAVTRIGWCGGVEGVVGAARYTPSLHDGRSASVYLFVSFALYGVRAGCKTQRLNEHKLADDVYI